MFLNAYHLHDLTLVIKYTVKYVGNGEEITDRDNIRFCFQNITPSIHPPYELIHHLTYLKVFKLLQILFITASPIHDIIINAPTFVINIF